MSSGAGQLPADEVVAAEEEDRLALDERPDLRELGRVIVGADRGLSQDQEGRAGGADHEDDPQDQRRVPRAPRVPRSAIAITTGERIASALAAM